MGKCAVRIEGCRLLGGEEWGDGAIVEPCCVYRVWGRVGRSGEWVRGPMGGSGRDIEEWVGGLLGWWVVVEG